MRQPPFAWRSTRTPTLALLPLCAAACHADLCTAQPKLALDGLYGVLAGLLGVNAFNERRVLLELLQQQRQAAADASTSSKDGGTT